ncbi:MAG: DNA mismatch repair endonuclease MutL, partial [Halobacteriaceae archaeon]
MTDIRQLDQSTIDRIAAGEVVERPAAALKELVENSLDAGADSVDVELEAGGTDLLRVADDGHGMTENAVERAVEKHTTSKIERLADLEHVGTLGFRGEALHAVAAVSRTTITTRAAESPRGTQLTVEGGEVVDVSPAGRPVGTTVAVRDLFYNVPAREKYLAESATEFAHCNRVVSRYALANPDVAVSLTHDGREVFATPGRGDLREAALAVYGREVAESLVPVDAVADAGDDGAVEDAESGADADAPLADAPLTRVHGYVSDPETTRSTREYLATYVNGRYVDDAGLRDAVLSAYGGQLAPDRYPFAVVFVECPPGAVDANVHPRKLEVRFSDPQAVR